VQPLRRACRQEVLNRLAVVNRRTIPDDEQLAPHLPHHLAEEGRDRGTAHRLLLDMGQQPPGRREGTDGREVVMPQRSAQHRRLPARGYVRATKGKREKPASSTNRMVRSSVTALLEGRARFPPATPQSGPHPADSRDVWAFAG